MKNKALERLSSWNTNELKEPFVSVCMLSYNHEKFIQQAIDSVLMQQVSFPVEIVLHDDASTDKTQEILKQYDQENSGLFKLLLQKENQRSKLGGGMNPRFNYPRAKGKYIALLEGDDYWTDPLKLQKQVDLLEEHEEFSFCATSYYQLINNQLRKINTDEIVSHEKIFFKNKSSTATLVFRKNIVSNILNEDLKGIKAGDWFIQSYACVFFGNGYTLPDNTSVYRIHSNGVWSNYTKKQMGKAGIKVLRSFEKIFNDKKSQFLIKKAINYRKKEFGLDLKSRILRIKVFKKLSKISR